MASGKIKEFQLQFTHISPKTFRRKLVRRIEMDDAETWLIDGQGYIRLVAPEYIDQGGLSCTSIVECVVVRAHNSQLAAGDCRHILLGKFIELVFDLRDRTLTPYIKHMASGPAMAPDATVELVSLREAVWRDRETRP